MKATAGAKAPKQDQAWLTSMEHPMRDDRSMAFLSILNRFGGGFWSWKLWVTPPVKSSKPSTVLPPDRAS